MTAIDGKDISGVYRAVVILHAIRFYLKTGMRVNSAYTATAMAAAASRITGEVFKRNQLLAASLKLQAWVEARKAEARHV